jgi:mRNA-degrading endonuclease RelE of RelBE toxin-antitoxin system
MRWRVEIDPRAERDLDRVTEKDRIRILQFLGGPGAFEDYKKDKIRRLGRKAPDPLKMTYKRVTQHGSTGTNQPDVWKITAEIPRIRGQQRCGFCFSDGSDQEIG